MALINPYIHFNGNAEEAFTFYKSVFGGEFSKVSRYKDEFLVNNIQFLKAMQTESCTLLYQLVMVIA